jgi:Secretion system C-terminal sorting domain/Beta-propeller repeat
MKPPFLQNNVFFTCLIFFLFSCLSLSSQTFEWAKQFEAMGSFNTPNDYPRAIKTDNNGNIFVVGCSISTRDFDPGTSAFPLTTSSSDISFPNGYIVKLDSTGNFVWAKQLACSGYVDIFSEFRIDSLGNIYIAGEYNGTCDFDPSVNSHNLTSSINYDTDKFILKLDNNGDFIWVKTIVGNALSEQIHFAIDNTGNTYVTGFLNDSNYVLKLNVNGNIAWMKKIGFWAFTESVSLDNLNHINVVGSLSNIIDFDPSTSVFNLTPIGGTDIYIWQLDLNGNFVWAKNIGGAGNVGAKSIAIDNNNNLYISGIYGGLVDFDPSGNVNSLQSTSSQNTYVLKLDNLGNFIWAKSINSLGSVYPRSIICDNQALYTTGFFTGLTDFDPGIGSFNFNSLFSRDIFVSKLNLNGDFLWAQKMGGDSDDFPNFITIDSHKNIYLAGNYQGPVADFNPPFLNTLSGNGVCGFIVKYNNQPIGLKNLEVISLIAYPNPVSDILTIDLENHFSKVEVTITNSLGQEVGKKDFENTTEINLSINGELGIYFIKLNCQTKTYNLKVIKQQ